MHSTSYVRSPQMASLAADTGAEKLFCLRLPNSPYTRTNRNIFQTKRFLRRLKLDLADEDRSALLDALAGPSASGARGASSERGVSFEGDDDGRGKKHAKRGGGGDKSDGDGGGVRVLYRDFLELVLAEQVLRAGTP